MTIFKSALAVAVSMFAANGAVAQSAAGDRGVEFGASSLGMYASADYTLSDELAVRVPIYFGSYNGEFDLDGNELDADLDILSGAAMLDYYLGNSGFRLSTGITFGGYSVTTSSVESIEFDGVTYSADFDFEVKQRNTVTPAIAVGYRHFFSDNWGLSAEAGVRMTRLEIEASGQEDLPADEREQFNDEIASFNDDLAFGALPFLSVGVNFRF